jgi:hypothetical protein
MRHVWQHANMPDKLHLNDQPDETDIMGAMIFNRYLEADAFAFGHAFIEDFEQRNGLDGIMTEYTLRSSRLGLNLRDIQHASYHGKVDFYAAALGRDGLNGYDYEAQALFTAFAEQRGAAVVATAPSLSPDMSAAAFAVEQLRDFDKPLMNIPAPFAHIKTVQDFCDPERLTLTPDVKEKAAALQKTFAQMFAQSMRGKEAPKLKGMTV